MKENEKYMRTCPKFQSCNAPVCPLDPNMRLRSRLENEDICKLPKSKRLVLGKELPNKGLMPRESAGEKNATLGGVRLGKEQS